MRKIYYIFFFIFCFCTGIHFTKAQTGCDLSLIRQTFTNAGCTELSTCLSSCSMYFYNPLSQTGNDAQAWAQNYGANLISVQSAAENSCIVSDLNNHGFSGIIWIGFNDIASEGSFVWYDQSPIVYTNWNSGEPNNSGNEDCVQIYPNGFWNDLNCGSGGSKSVIEVNLCPTTTITPTATTICAGQSVTLAASTILGSSPYTYSWTSNIGGFVSTSVGPTVTPLSTTTYNVTSTDRYGCTATASIQITVNNSLNATISGTTSVCQNATAPNITFTGSSGTPPYTFTYMINGGSSQTVTTTSGSNVTVPVSTTTAGTFIYTLSHVSDNNGCSQARSGEDTVTVVALPTATIIGDTTVCKDATSPNITFTGSGGIPPPYTFTYTINGGSSQTISTVGADSSVTLPVPTATSGTFVYTLTQVQSGNSASCSQAQGGNATVIVDPLPTATIAGTIAICKNNIPPSITFTGASGTAPYTFTYSLNNGTNETITTTSGNTITLSVPTGVVGTFVYSLVSVRDASTHSCSQAQTGTATVTVNPLPTATIAGATDVCKNSTAPDITFTGASGTSPYTFTYTINGVTQPTVTTTSGNSVTVSVPTSVVGTFTYGLVTVKDASASTCAQAQTGTAIVNVKPLPTATIIGTTAVCKNATGPLVKLIGASGTAPYTYTYTLNGGTNQTVVSTNGDTAYITAPTSTVGTYVYQLLNVQDGSTATYAQTQTGNATITVNPLPTATIAGNTTICKDAPPPSITFTATGGTMPYTFDYTINNGAIQTVSSNTGDSIAALTAATTVSGTFTYTLISVTDASTTACEQLQTGTATVIVNPLPTAQITGNTGVCEGAASPNITFTGANATAPYTFTYTVNGGANQIISNTGGNSVLLPVSTLIAGTYTYNLVSVQEGSTTTCSQLQDGNATVIVHPNPLVNFSANDSIGCGPLCINFIDQSSISLGANANLLWDFGDGNTGNVATHCYTNNPSNGGSISAPISYNVGLTVTSDSGCVTSFSRPNFITVYPSPIANFTPQPTTANIVNPIISVTNLSQGANAWNWDFGDSTSSINQNPISHTYADTGTYQIALITSNQFMCEDTAHETIIIEPDFFFYIPSAFSPNGDGLNDYFECKGLFFTDFEVKIFDRWGNLIFKSNHIEKPWDGKANYGSDLAQQEVYVYLITVMDLKLKKHEYRGIVSLIK
jgi:gliding motility-associated-like protein